jgi:hypothetical protein
VVNAQGYRDGPKVPTPAVTGIDVAGSWVAGSWVAVPSLPPQRLAPHGGHAVDPVFVEHVEDGALPKRPVVADHE